MNKKNHPQVIVKSFYFFIICSLCVGLLTGIAPHNRALAKSTDQPAALVRSLAELLNPDGSLDLSSGFRGSLDGRGWQLASGPDEAPRFVPIAGANDHWIGSFGRPGSFGANANIYAVVLDGNGGLYMGGSFTTAGNWIANRIIHWNGSSWSKLGSGIPNGNVYALLVDPSGNLYVGGSFADAGGNLAADRIAMWDGSAWNALGNGLGGDVRALLMDSGDLYVAGSFDNAGGNQYADKIAVWDGSAWSNLGTGSKTGTAYTILMAGSNLYLGGTFSDFDGNPDADRIAMWDGGAWNALGSGISNNDVFTLAYDGSGGYLYVGGSFNDAGGNLSADKIARWDGADWTEFSPAPSGSIRALYLVGADLYVGGEFQNLGSDAGDYIVRWDFNTSAWYPLSTGASARVNSLTYDGSNLFAGGEFTSAGSAIADRVAQWDGVDWLAVGNGGGLNNTVYALAPAGAGELYAGGIFLNTAGQYLNRIGFWNGAAWEALGSGIYPSGAYVYAVAVASNGDVYVGGSFNDVGGSNGDRIVRWDGLNWNALGTGIGNGEVRALVLDGSGNLFVGGSFTNVGGNLDADRVAVWDGNAWEALGPGIPNNTVYALELTAGGQLYAAGSFTDVGGNPDADRIVLWDSGAWNPLASGIANGEVRALESDSDGNLYAGGNFTDQGDPSGDRIVRWDGSAWHTLGSGITSGYVHALALNGMGSLFVGGSFNDAGGNTSADRIALWDGTWRALGGGVNSTGDVFSLMLDGDWDVYVGGSFYQAGDKGSAYLAHWTNTQPTVADDFYSITEDTVLSTTVSVLSNDIDADFDILTAVPASTPIGELDLHPDGQFIYTPTLNYTGLVTFTYQAVDEFSAYDTGLVTIEVIGVNDAPVAADDTGATNEDTLIDLEVLVNDSDVEGDELTVSEVTQPPHGTAQIINGGSQVRYTPALNYNGLDTFAYVVSDGFLTDTATVDVTVLPVNDAPVAYGDVYTVTEDTALNVTQPGVLANDVDIDGDALSAALENAPAHGDVTVNPNGSFLYTPDQNYNGPDSFTYRASDGSLSSAPATVQINVTPVNDPPIAVDDVYNTTEDATLIISAPGVLGNDQEVDGDPLTAALASLPAHGSVSFLEDGSFEYTPEHNFDGSDSFTYTALDDHGGADTGTVTIVVNGLNDDPIVSVSADQNVINEGGSVAFTGSFTDPGLQDSIAAGEEIFWEFDDGSSANDTLNPIHTYWDDGAFNATLIVTDTQGDSGEDSEQITVLNVAPTLDEIPDQDIYITDTLNLYLTFNDPGVLDTHTVTIEWSFGQVETFQLPAGVSELTVEHNFAAVGQYNVVVSVTDDDEGTDFDTVRIRVVLPGQNFNNLYLPIIQR